MSTAGGPATSGRGRGLRIVSQTTDAEFRRFYHAEWHSVLGLAVVLCDDDHEHRGHQSEEAIELEP